MATYGEGDQTVRRWDEATGQSFGEPIDVNGHRGKIHTLVTLPGRPARLTSGDKDGMLRVWDPLTGAEAGSLDLGGSVHDLAVGASGTLLAAGPGGLHAIDLGAGDP
ncbi:hypothetical protein [Actinoplanes sp. CA-252034]|uniref:hypothetical protein n=1 Tax=Actinoplanes sp. CA-252034 TaxID=3239906 RepID=UPI003D9517CB